MCAARALDPRLVGYLPMRWRGTPGEYYEFLVKVRRNIQPVPFELLEHTRSVMTGRRPGSGIGGDPSPIWPPPPC